MALPSFTRPPAFRSWGRRCLGIATLALLVSSTVACSKGGTILFWLEPAPAPPPYKGRISNLFDDSVSPRFINASYGASVDTLLPFRLHEADAVLGGRVRTLDAETRAGKTTFRLGLDSLSSVAGDVPDGPLYVVIAPENPAYGMIRIGRKRLLGQRAIVIVKYFADAELGTVSHVRLEPDDQTTRDALAAARL